MASSEKKIPTSLKDCYTTDRVSDNLWSWSDWLEVWGGRILIFLIIVGIISTIGDGIEMVDTDGELDFITIITSIITRGFYAFITYCSYKVLSLLVASLATIVQNTRITANVSLYNTAKKEGILNEEDKNTTSSTQNKSYSLTRMADSRNNDKNSSWICKECGTKNDASNLYCKDCGKYK